MRFQHKMQEIGGIDLAGSWTWSSLAILMRAYQLQPHHPHDRLIRVEKLRVHMHPNTSGNDKFFAFVHNHDTDARFCITLVLPYRAVGGARLIPVVRIDACRICTSSHMPYCGILSSIEVHSQIWRVRLLIRYLCTRTSWDSSSICISTVGKLVVATISYVYCRTLDS